MEYIHGGDIYTYQGMTDFSVNINPFGPSKGVLEAVRNGAGEIGLYPDSRCGELRAALAEKLKVAPESLIFGNGAAELIFLAVQALRPGRALITAPAFAEYRQALKTVDCRIDEYRTGEENGFQIREDYLSYLTEETELVFLCSPDNPSGNIIGKELLLKILRACEEKQIHMILDECFLDFLEEPEKQTLLKETQKCPWLFILRAFTKIYAMPGLRLGYGVSTDVNLLETMRKMRQPWSVSGIAQKAGAAALKEDEYVRKTREFLAGERAWMEKMLAQAGVQFFPSHANFILLKSPWDLFEEMKERGFLIRDCSNYPGLQKGYYRIAIRKRGDNEKLIRALKEVYSNKREKGE